MPNVEEVFRISGIPTHTFVEPHHYGALRVSLRSPGQCSVIEGPSGIGKTTSVMRLLDELGMADSVTVLSARTPSDIDLISELPNMKDIGTVIVDDFHRLEDSTKGRLSDFMKVLVEAGDNTSKLVLIGINRAGERLVNFGHDVGLRIDVFRLEANPDYKVEKLIRLGQEALNIEIKKIDDYVTRSQGSFQIAQMLCKYLCMKEEVFETAADLLSIDTSVEVVTDMVMVELRRLFNSPSVAFARGSKLRREGRAPYLHILKWLCEGEDWSLDLRSAIQTRPEHRSSVGQVVDKGYLETLVWDPEKGLSEFFHYQPETKVLSVEDPRLVFYLKNLNWRSFTREVGYTTSYFPGRYDVALSFAGENRALAASLFDALSEREVSVFYDYNEQHRILAQNVEDYLSPIYRSEALYVVPILSGQYPRKIWTKFESDQFRSRFGDNAVIPIRMTDTAEGFFSDTAGYGGLVFDPTAPAEPQVQQISELLCRKLEEDRLVPDDAVRDIREEIS